MTDNDQRDAIESVPRVAPTLQLSRRGLVLCLLAMIGVGLSVYAMFPASVGGPSLPVNVELDVQAVAVETGGGAVMTEGLVIKNLKDHPIGRLSIEINGQYLLFRESPLQGLETLVLPQRIFTDKRSSARLDPIKYPVQEVVVTGQLPSGARGLSQFEFDSDDKNSVESGELQ